MRKFIIGGAVLAMAVTGLGLTVKAQDQPFGGADSISYAVQLWDAMEAQRLVGDNAIRAFPYTGGAPHGDILVTLESDLTIDGHKGAIIVKKNYTLEFATVEDVANNPGQQHDVTIMFHREDGYDPDNQDWFWAKFTAEGEILSGPPGALAGRVFKGMDVGCIACHKGAPGGDMVFINDRHAGM